MDQEEIPDYYDIIEHPMDLSIIMVNIDEHEYETVEDMLNDINLIGIGLRYQILFIERTGRSL